MSTGQSDPLASAGVTQGKPSEVTTISIMTLISGISNILTAMGLSFTVVLGTLGVGLLCLPLTILPGVLGVFEIITASKMLSTPPKPVNSLRTIAILEICAILFLNVISLVTGILTLVFLDNPRVRSYIESWASPPTSGG